MTPKPVESQWDQPVHRQHCAVFNDEPCNCGLEWKVPNAPPKPDLAQFIAEELFDSNRSAISAIANMIRPILEKWKAAPRSEAEADWRFPPDGQDLNMKEVGEREPAQLLNSVVEEHAKDAEELEQLKDWLAGKGLCGKHPAQFEYTPDKGQHIYCLVCEFESGEREPAAQPPLEKELIEALRLLIPIAESGGNLGQVCNGCQRNSFEFGQHSENCPVLKARAVLRRAESGVVAEPPSKD